jgi:hypothetical protein
MGNEYTILMENMKGRKFLGDLGLGGRKILKSILKK